MNNEGRPEVARRRGALSRRLPLILITYALTLGGVGAFFAFTSGDPSGEDFSRRFQLYAAVALTVVSVTVTAYVFGRSQGRREAGAVRIALAGPPLAGKTVFVNILMNVLMSSLDPGLQFIPETRTALVVVRAARRLAAGVWPTPTVDTGVYRYGGTIQRPRTLWRSLFAPDYGLRLEVADFAGEYWHDIQPRRSREEPGAHRGEEEGPVPLSESSYFEYVAEADSLLYFVPADQLLEGSQSLRSTVEDAVSAVQLLVATRPPGRSRRPVAIGLVISKSDLLSERQIHLVKQLVEGRHEFSLLEDAGPEESWQDLERSFFDSIKVLERLVSVISRRVDFYQGFVLSSIDTAFATGVIDEVVLSYSEESIRSISGSARRSRDSRLDLLDPVRWSLWFYLRGRRTFMASRN